MSATASPARDAATAEPLLAMRAIEKRFGGVCALAGAELEARAGEIHGLCGENGAGKSTLLKILAGVYPHGSYGGEVRLAGRPLALRSTADARSAGIAIVHQELMLVPELSVAANLFLGREPGRFGLCDDLAAEAEATALLERFGVGGEIDPRTPVGELGIGRQQTVEIVRALAADVRLLVLDEPTAALTADECARLLGWLRGLRARGTTCLYVSHRMDEVFALCDRITVLRDGRTAGTVVTRETRSQSVIALMVGRELPEALPRAGVAAASATVPALELSGLTLADPHGAPVLDGISLTVAPGEVVALAGAMGSGRTALLSSLFGLARGTLGGTVRLAGRPAAIGSPAQAIALGLALVPEDRKGQGLVLGLSIAANLALARGARGSLFGLTDDLAEEAEAQRAIEGMRLCGLAGAEVATLSGGNQQKVAIGKWLAGGAPRVLLLDEPTRGVDVGAREEIYALLEGLGRRGTAILMASSDLPEVLRLAHRVLVLHKGRLAGALDGATATEADIVRLSTGAEALPVPGEACA